MGILRALLTGVRYRQSIKVAPGVRLNLGRRGPSSWTLGPRGATYNTRRRRVRIDAPGPFAWESPPIDLDGNDEQTVPAVRALAVACSTCGARPGEECITRRGHLTNPHRPRIRLARRTP